MAPQRVWRLGLDGGTTTVACMISFQSVTASPCAAPAPYRTQAVTIEMPSRLLMRFIVRVLSSDREFPLRAPAPRRYARTFPNRDALSVEGRRGSRALLPLFRAPVPKHAAAWPFRSTPQKALGIVLYPSQRIQGQGPGPEGARSNDGICARGAWSDRTSVFFRGPRPAVRPATPRSPEFFLVLARPPRAD